MIFLVIYDTRAGVLSEIHEYEDSDRALATKKLRSSQETHIEETDHIEIALFEAPSRETLEQTHSRYFRTLSELGASIERGVTKSVRSY